MLNRAEWVKFVAVFFNKEVEAEKMFSNITMDYQNMNKTARTAAAKDPQRPTVAWISKTGDTIIVAYANYKKQFLEVGTAFGFLCQDLNAEQMSARMCITC